jgi:hypothetical protein
MKKAIAIGMIGFALLQNRAAAQTAVEQATILRDFQLSVVAYTKQHKCLAMFPEALNAATPAPKIFTLPVAVVFRQLIARAAADRPDVDLATVLKDALPPLPATLEYRLVDRNLVLHDTDANLNVATLREAIDGYITAAKQ